MKWEYFIVNWSREITFQNYFSCFLFTYFSTLINWQEILFLRKQPTLRIWFLNAHFYHWSIDQTNLFRIIIIILYLKYFNCQVIEAQDFFLMLFFIMFSFFLVFWSTLWWILSLGLIFFIADLPIRISCIRIHWSL